MTVVLSILAAALAAKLLVYCYRQWRSERRYIARVKARRERIREDMFWLICRESEAEHARKLVISVERARTFRAGLRSAS